MCDGGGGGGCGGSGRTSRNPHAPCRRNGLDSRGWGWEGAGCGGRTNRQPPACCGRGGLACRAGLLPGGRTRPTQVATLAALAGAAIARAGGTPPIATKGYGEAVAQLLPPAPAGETPAAPDSCGGASSGKGAPDAAASSTRPAGPPPPRRVFSMAGWPGVCQHPERPRDLVWPRFPLASGRSCRGLSRGGPPAAVPLGVPRRAPRVTTPPAFPPCPAARMPQPHPPWWQPSPRRMSYTGRPAGDDAAAVAAAWQRRLGGDTRTAQRDLTRPAALAA